MAITSKIKVSDLSCESLEWFLNNYKQLKLPEEIIITIKRGGKVEYEAIN